MTQLRKGRADDISCRKTLINVFVNAIYLYDDKLVIFFNSGDKPVTIDDELLDKIENSAGFVFGAFASTSPEGRAAKHRGSSDKIVSSSLDGEFGFGAFASTSQ